MKPLLATVLSIAEALHKFEHEVLALPVEEFTRLYAHFRIKDKAQKVEDRKNVLKGRVKGAAPRRRR